MATKTVPGDKPTPTASVTAIATKQREAALVSLLGEIAIIASTQAQLIELGCDNLTDRADADAVMLGAAQLGRTIGQLADRASRTHVRDADDWWCFSDIARGALDTLEGRNEEAAA